MSAPALAVAATQVAAASSANISASAGLFTFALLFGLSFIISLDIASKKDYKSPLKLAFVAAVVTTAFAGIAVLGIGSQMS